MKKFFISLMIVMGSIEAMASNSKTTTNEYIISVARVDAVKLEEVKSLINMYVDLGMDEKSNHCYAVSTSTFISSSDPNYFGDFVVTLTASCDQAADQILAVWKSSPILTIYNSNPVEPFPSVTIIN